MEITVTPASKVKSCCKGTAFKFKLGPTGCVSDLIKTPSCFHRLIIDIHSFVREDTVRSPQVLKLRKTRRHHKAEAILESNRNAACWSEVAYDCVRLVIQKPLRHHICRTSRRPNKFNSVQFNSFITKKLLRYSVKKGIGTMDPCRIRSYLQVACAGLGFEIGEIWWTSNEHGSSTVAAIGTSRFVFVVVVLPSFSCAPIHPVFGVFAIVYMEGSGWPKVLDVVPTSSQLETMTSDYLWSHLFLGFSSHLL